MVYPDYALRIPRLYLLLQEHFASANNSLTEIADTIRFYECV